VPVARHFSAHALDLVAQQQGRFPWLIPSVFIRRHASMMAWRFSFPALLTACPEFVCDAAPWHLGDRGLIMADNDAMPGGSSNSSCHGDPELIASI
jgi:hypothetical protein